MNDRLQSKLLHGNFALIS